MSRGKSDHSDSYTNVKGLTRCSLVWCLGAASVVAGRRKTAPSLALVLAASLVSRSRGNPAHSPGKFSHSVLWFLAPSVRLVQGIGSRHSALGANTKQRVTGI